MLTYNILSVLKAVALPPAFAAARPKRLRFAVFTLPGRVTAHAHRLAVRVATVLAEAVDLLQARQALRRLQLAAASGG